MKRQRGFSLIELLIVVAIILIIAAIAIPNLLRARIAANEASAVGSLRTINTAEITYNSSYNMYACNLSNLGPASGGGTTVTSAAAGLIDGVLSAGIKSGYSFSTGTCTSTTYQYQTQPVSAGKTGNRYFCTDASAVIMVDPTNTSMAVCLSTGKGL